MNLSEAGLTLLKKHLIESELFEMNGKGTSMFPLISEGETCEFKPADLKDLKPGNVYLYTDDTGRFIVHRLIREEQSMLYLKGDANLGMDPPVRKNQVIGELLRVKKKAKWISPNDRIWKSFSWLLRYQWFRKLNVRLSKKKV